MLKIYVNTWGNYNENGAAGGEWIRLPDPDLDETLEAIAERIGDTDPEWFINDYEWIDNSFGPIHEMEDLEELNDKCEALFNLSSFDIEKLVAAVEVDDDLDQHLDNLDNYHFYHGMTLEEVAEEIVEECYNLPEFALRYFDYEAFARDLRFDGYTETAHGVICIC